jgi:crotonobetainyl-CoA:carnitine CoA-transferase CaiB-like acyl-CoA transferase
LVAAWTVRHDLMPLAELLLEHRVPSAPIYTVEDVFRDPHVHARDMLVAVPDAEIGSVTLTGIVPKLSATPGALQWSGRALGADTRAVLSEELGMGATELDRLEAAGVIVSSGPPR